MYRSLVLAMLLGASACYDPQAVNCTVSCASANECANGQVCGADGFCAAPDVAGHCGGPDGGIGSQSVSLRIAIEGSGKVMIDGVGQCDDGAPDHACVFSVRTNVPLALKATPKKDHEFSAWSGACTGGSTSCALTPVTATTQVTARFQ